MKDTILAIAVLLLAPPAALHAAEPSKPNIVFILADDLGYGDLGCFGAKDIQTPHIDSLARDDMKFTSFYVHQRCSPSRLAFMTGSYANRTGTTKVICPRDRIGINPAEITTPELLKQGGYSCGIVGKWHLGDWKLFLKAQKPGGKRNQWGDRRETPAGSLYNVKADPSETRDVAAEHPDVVQRLRVAAEAFEKELAAHSRPIGRLEPTTQTSDAANSSKKKQKSKP